MDDQQPASRLVGLISDTHGHLRPRVFTVFDGVDRILHAGDIEDPDILTDLMAIAPVTAVSGNVDGSEIRAAVPEEATLKVGGVQIALIHGHQVHPDYRLLLGRFPDAAVIVHGHSHVPRCDSIGQVMIVNPGAAGKAQKGYPPMVALLEVVAGRATVKHVELKG